jgi:hypothetical protein
VSIQSFLFLFIHNFFVVVESERWIGRKSRERTKKGRRRPGGFSAAY